MSDTTPRSKTIVCEEVFHENSIPSEGEVIDYAKNIGINPECEPHLLPIALKGLMQPLPLGWRPCFDVTLRRWYYYNDITKESQWEHPLDDVFRDLVKRGRSEGYSSAAEDDSKLTKEGVKSFEEVSDLLSSISNDTKPDVPLSKMSEPDKGKDAHPKVHQPLLLRRKQLQHNANPQQFVSLHAKPKNSINDYKEDERGFQNVVTENRTFRVSPAKVGDSLTRYSSSSSLPKESGTNKMLQPLRRAQTLDPIPTFISTNPKADPPIKGILRESSFSSLPNRNLARLNPIQGDSPTSHEIEDEKKRSVRFADFERKSLDIKFQFSDSDRSTSEEASDPSSQEEDKNECEAEKFIEQLNGLNENLKVQQLDRIKNKLSNKIVNTALATPLAIQNLSDDSAESESKNEFKLSLSDKIEEKERSPKSTSPILRSPLKKSLNSLINEDSHGADFPDSQLLTSSGISSSSCKKSIDPEIISLREAIKSIVGFDGKQSELEAIAKNKTNAKIALLEEKLAIEIEHQITQLKTQQAERLNKLKEELEKNEEAEKEKLAEQASSKLNDLKKKLDIELGNKEKEIREEDDKEMKELLGRLENEKANRIAAKMIEFKADEDRQITDIKNKGLLRIEEVKSFFEGQVKEAEQKYDNEVKKLESVLMQKIDNLKMEKEAELKRIQTEWDDKITTNSVQNKSILESASKDHERNMTLLRQQFQREEEVLKRLHAEEVEAWNSKIKKLNDKEPNSLTVNRDFEKMRCEKRLIEDKYRSLKDKYLQLKSDIEIAVERKLQSRSRKRKEERNQEKELKESNEEKGTTESKNKGKNNNPELDPGSNEKQGKLNKMPKINTDQLNVKEGVENDPSSDDQYTSLSLTLPNDEQRSQNVSSNRNDATTEKKKLSRGKLRLDHSRDRQGNVLDDVRSQLRELEEIEEQIPANSQGDTYLRYPFHGQGFSTSAEVDFYRHRVIVEQEAVRAARECLLQQKRELDARQTFLKSNNNSTMQQLQQQERDLTEMEVSLYRTKALLGEKMIRLRLLGQTLNRIIEDFPNSQNDANDPKDNITTPISATTPGVFPAESVPYNVLQNLENIYSEIGEIQSQLNKQNLNGISEPMGMDNLYLKLPPGNPLAKPLRRVPSNRIEVESRLRDIQDWLQKTAPKQH